jgi:cytoskeletal protein CcmA (bactofilin family)
MFNKRRSLLPTRKNPAKPEPRTSEPPPRIELPSFRPTQGRSQAASSAQRTARPNPAPAQQPSRPVSRPQPGPVTRPVPGPVQPPARPVAQPIAGRTAGPSVTQPILGPGQGTPTASSKTVGRVMLVGADIRLNADIGACERLVVEGTVEGELSEAERLEIARGGRFRGTAEVEDCVVDGLFEGDLTVHGVLALKANGRVTGTVRYGAIEIERGGTISGNFGTHGAPRIATGSAAALRPAGNGATTGRRPA